MDIEKYRRQDSSIVSDKDRIIYKEVLLACEHGIYRGAYVLAWIAIIESLKGKIYDLADLGDSRATNVKSNIEDGENKHLSTDRTIFEGAANCEIVPAIYISELNYLWEQRCLYAHPYQHSPNEGDVMHIIDKALEITLTKELMYSRDRIDSFIKEEMDAFHLVPSLEDAQTDHIRHHLSLVKEKHYAPLFKNLFYWTRICMDTKQHSKLRYVLRFIRIFVAEKNPNLNDASFSIQKGVANYPNTMWFVAAMPEVWGVIDAIHQDGLFRYLDSCADKDIYHGLQSVRYLLNHGADLSEQQLKVYYTKLAQLKLANVWQYYVDHSLLLERIQNEWITNDWNDHAKFVNWLNEAENSISDFDQNFIETMGEFLARCCVSNAFVAHKLVESKDLGWFENKDFIVGLGAGFFIDNNEFKCQFNYHKKAIDYIANLSHELMDLIADKLAPLPFYNTNPHRPIQASLKSKVVEYNDNWTDKLRDLLNERIDGCFMDYEI